jgi:hypothetical protein
MSTIERNKNKEIKAVDELTEYFGLYCTIYSGAKCTTDSGAKCTIL